MNPKTPIALVFGWLALASIPGYAAESATAPGTARQSGTVTGRVFNPANGEYVRNAEIRIAGTAFAVYSGKDGTYRMPNLPAGPVTLTVTYAGYETETAMVNAVANAVTQRDFEMRSATDSNEIVQLDRMTVTGALEGNAKAMMEQRAAMNVKSVVASDAFGDLSEGNVGELLQYLPGVDIVYDQSDMTGASIGGMAPKYGALMVDGIRVSSTSGTGRGPGFSSINVRVAEMIELNKTVAADMDADAPAGSINLRSKTAFQRKGRQISWQLYASANSEKLALKRMGGPSDSKHHQIHPSGNIEILDTFLDGRLGVVASFDWTHVIHERHHLRHTINTAPTAINPDPLVLTQISYTDGPKSNRNIRGNLRFDYKVNDRLSLALSGQARRADTRIYDRTFSLVAARNDIARGSNASFQVVNGTTSATRMSMSGGFQERDDQSESYSAHLFYDSDRVEIDGAVSFSQVDVLHRNGRPDGTGDGPPSQQTISLFPVSWRMERSGPAETAWNFQQIAGPDLYDLDNWNFSFPTANVARNGQLHRPTRKKYSGHLNAKLSTEGQLPAFFKAGLKIQEEIYSIRTGSHTWTYVGPRDAAAVVSPVGFDPKLGGNLFSDRAIQYPNRNTIADLMLSNPAYFQANPADATNAANTAPTRYVKEQITAAYLMGNTQLGRLILQGGGRIEKTRTGGRIYERGEVVSRKGKYNNVFWSGSAKYRITDGLFAIAGYNQSIARPSFSNLTGVLSVNDETLIGDIPNPALRPEYGDNYTARLEYYLKSAGIISVGVFQRKIENLHVQRSQIPAEDLGLDQDYPGYLFTSWTNAGEGFRTEGYEIEYNQQLTKLPGVLKGLGVFANYTRVKNSHIAFAYGLSPKRVSGGFTYRYKSFSGSLRGSWIDDTLTSATLYRKARTILGLSLRYQLPRNTAIFLNGRNITKDPITSYLNSQPDLLSAYGQFGSNWTVGVEGRF